MDYRSQFDYTMGGADAINQCAALLTGDEFNALLKRVDELVIERKDDAVLRRDVEQAFRELFPEKDGVLLGVKDLLKRA